MCESWFDVVAKVKIYSAYTYETSKNTVAGNHDLRSELVTKCLLSIWKGMKRWESGLGKKEIHVRCRPALTSPSAHDNPKKIKKTIVAENTIDTIVYPRWMWIRKALSRGKYLFNLLLEKEAIEYLLMVKGMSAIWKRMACIEPNSIGGISRFAQYLGAPSGTAFSCCWNLMSAKWAAWLCAAGQHKSDEVRRERIRTDLNWTRQ